MSATRVSLVDAWRNRRPFERWMILAPAVALVVVVLEIGVVEPLSAASARMRAALPTKIAQRDLVDAQAREVRSTTGASAPRALDRTAIEPTLTKFGIPAGQASVEAAGNDRLRLAIARAPFHALVPLLATLQQQHGVRAVALRIDRLDASDARLEATLAAR
jgi:type II secretory pathway component PulM